MILKRCCVPVYLLEEIWDLLRSSPPDVVASMVSYLNGRLSNKSPIVKQKACLFSISRSLLLLVWPSNGLASWCVSCIHDPSMLLATSFCLKCRLSAVWSKLEWFGRSPSLRGFHDRMVMLCSVCIFGEFSSEPNIKPPITTIFRIFPVSF